MHRDIGKKGQNDKTNCEYKAESARFRSESEASAGRRQENLRGEPVGRHFFYANGMSRATAATTPIRPAGAAMVRRIFGLFAAAREQLPSCQWHAIDRRTPAVDAPGQPA
ncbi:MAG: hypothetical protein WA924_09480 [Burkholderiaceae bacterium]